MPCTCIDQYTSKTQCPQILLLVEHMYLGMINLQCYFSVASLAKIVIHLLICYKHLQEGLYAVDNRIKCKTIKIHLYIHISSGRQGHISIHNNSIVVLDSNVPNSLQLHAIKKLSSQYKHCLD